MGDRSFSTEWLKSVFIEKEREGEVHVLVETASTRLVFYCRIKGIEDLIKIELRFSDFADHSMLRLLDLFTDGPGVLFDLREQVKSFTLVIRMHLLSVSYNEGLLSVSCTLLISS